MEVPFVPRTIKGMHTVWVFLATNTSHKFGSNMKYFQYFILLFDVQRIRFLGASPYQSFPLPGKEWNSWKEGLHLIPGEILTHFSKNRGLFFLLLAQHRNSKLKLWYTDKLQNVVRDWWEREDFPRSLTRNSGYPRKSWCSVFLVIHRATSVSRSVWAIVTLLLLIIPPWTSKYFFHIVAPRILSLYETQFSLKRGEGIEVHA